MPFSRLCLCLHPRRHRFCFCAHPACLLLHSHARGASFEPLVPVSSLLCPALPYTPSPTVPVCFPIVPPLAARPCPSAPDIDNARPPRLPVRFPHLRQNRVPPPAARTCASDIDNARAPRLATRTFRGAGSASRSGGHRPRIRRHAASALAIASRCPLVLAPWRTRTCCRAAARYICAEPVSLPHPAPASLVEPGPAAARAFPCARSMRAVSPICAGRGVRGACAAGCTAAAVCATRTRA
ncbi:hypothetical protein B0H15DRAFT_89113 [Mycena belliarum]|uniref:Uncharacterized protein n=1 Tax=Mycena belliarum TaxID=1033014 RepID=A0AAD6TN73_9AGAR|nr:hypothetical protein B0H15DRAFT_89113 [Mycena belliae]